MGYESGSSLHKKRSWAMSLLSLLKKKGNRKEAMMEEEMEQEMEDNAINEALERLREMDDTLSSLHHLGAYSHEHWPSYHSTCRV
ncbi:unnamed protein product [Darwinula stevensoni]|uniref:Uncharacterized protein n=1 Tax=Darwinula stevensoni TaxID=69355 RepID=A0A7R9A690_9CRUS|nr:unnamed protein product [Darwinula stevensoni]CAG0893738.1 unnamed protein product [Darwinula stevensoni]